MIEMKKKKKKNPLKDWIENMSEVECVTYNSACLK